MLDVPEGLVGSVLLELRSLWGCWGDSYPQALWWRCPTASLACSIVLLTPLGFRPSPATKGFSIILEREELPVGTRFSWGHQDQLGLGTCLVASGVSSLWALTAAESSPRKRMSL